jgi:hypothetical protein
MKTISMYFNIISTVLFQLLLSVEYEFQRISTDLFQHYFNIISTLFQHIHRIKDVERRKLFQHYFNIFNPPGSLMHASAAWYRVK